MERNTIFAIILSMLFLLGWFTFFQKPAKSPVVPGQQVQETLKSVSPQSKDTSEARSSQEIAEKEITVDAKNYKAVFTSRGAAIKHWYLKGKETAYIDLVMVPDSTALSTFPDLNFSVVEQVNGKVIFSAVTPEGVKITKTYELSDNYLHRLTIETLKTNPAAALPQIVIRWDSGLGTDTKEEKENLRLTRALAFPKQAPHKLEKLKAGDYPAKDFAWAAIDNRYFLAAFIPHENSAFGQASVIKGSKSTPPELALIISPATSAETSQTNSFQLYLGPKGYAHLKTLNLRLEETVDFGFFGFLGKIVLKTLNTFHKLTGNYGWSIILLTIVLQLIVLPLSLKSFKATIAMKRLQPHIKEIQEKYKGDAQRLNMEMMNLYKTRKVNPLGGCLPMILQLPIFWALFTTLRNAYELRGAPWMLWIKDLSAPDTLLRVGNIPLNVLPLVMGIGMFVQQKMMSPSTDPSQKMMMYMMPGIFIFIFWNFPSGLVLYWLVNSIMTMAEQYVIMKREEQNV